jgi:large subunit ribosomal protein L22
MVTAKLKNYRQSPRKVRLLAGLVKNKTVEKALHLLDFSDKRASGPVKKLLKSAIANAKTNFGLSEEGLYVKEIRVDDGRKGRSIRRIRPGAQGKGYPIRKRLSHISLILENGGTLKK